MNSINPLVEKQYAEWVYPEPIMDLAADLSQSVFQLCDPSHSQAILWPERAYNPEMTILVAGCGTSQAPSLAYSNPHASVVGIDLSDTSLDYSARLKQKHRLDNLELLRLDLHQVATLGRQFDLVVSTGVLHHLPDAQTGLEALAGVVADDGVLHVMLYGRYPRVGVYMVQEALSRMEIDQTPEGVSFARRVVQAVPDWHAVRAYLRSTDDLRFDGGIVDTFLHKQDRAFSVTEILDLAKASNLHFQGWLDNMNYYPEAAMTPDNPIYKKLVTLPEETQWAVIELLAMSLGCHRFQLRKKTSDPRKFRIDFNDASFPQMVPVLSYRLKADDDGSAVTLGRSWHTSTLGGRDRDLFLAIDGKTSVGTIIEAQAGSCGTDAAHRFFQRMWKLGHVLFTRVPPEI